MSRRYLRNGERFAAHAPLYPVCWLYNNVEGYEFRDLTGAPILLQCGAADDYDAPEAAQTLLDGLDTSDRASLKPSSIPTPRTPSTRSTKPAKVVSDPFAHQGRGGEVRVHAEPGSRPPPRALRRRRSFAARCCAI